MSLSTLNNHSLEQQRSNDDNFTEVFKKNFTMGLNGLQTSFNVSIKLDQLSETKAIFDQLKEFSLKMQSFISNPEIKIDPSECHKELTRICGNNKNGTTHFKQTLPLLSSKQCLTPDDVKTVVTETDHSLASMANRMIAISVCLSTVTIICQFRQLQKVWKVINDAKNVVDESSVVLNYIRFNMTELEKGIHELEGLMNLYEIGPEEKHDQIVRNIQRKYVRIGALYNEIRLKLSELKIKVGGKLESFEKYQEDKRRDLLMNSVVSAANFVSNIAQSYVLGGVGNGFLNAASSLTTTALATMTVANLGTMVIGEQLLADLRQMVSTIDQLQRNLLPIKERMDAIEKWLEEHDRIDA